MELKARLWLLQDDRMQEAGDVSGKGDTWRHLETLGDTWDGWLRRWAEVWCRTEDLDNLQDTCQHTLQETQQQVSETIQAMHITVAW
jgi:hypothetical protein